MHKIAVIHCWIIWNYKKCISKAHRNTYGCKGTFIQNTSAIWQLNRQRYLRQNSELVLYWTKSTARSAPCALICALTRSANLAPVRLRSLLPTVDLRLRSLRPQMSISLSSQYRSGSWMSRGPWRHDVPALFRQCKCSNWDCPPTMRRNVKILLSCSVAWTFVVVYYLQTTGDVKVCRRFAILFYFTSVTLFYPPSTDSNCLFHFLPDFS